MEPRGQQWKGRGVAVQGNRQLPPMIFSLAGFVQSPAVSAQQVREQKDELIGMIRELGGSVIEKDEWDPRVTHVVAHVDGKKESMSEKVMAALAGGRWVVTRRFVDRSYRQGAWLPSPKPFVINDAVLRHRLRAVQAGAQGGAFWGFRAALLLSDPRKNGVYSRVITAGGGVLLETSLEELVASPPSPASLTHLFIDPWAVGQGDPRAPLLHKLRQACPHLWMLFYKFLFMKVRQNIQQHKSTFLRMIHHHNLIQVRQYPPPGEQEYSVFEPRIQEQGEKDRLAWLAQQERSKMQAQKTGNKRAAGEGREMPTFKRRKGVEGSQVEVLTLEDSEEEREDAIGDNSSQSKAGNQARLDSLPSINSTQTQTPAALARLKSLPITVVGEVALSGTDSEDDVQVNSTESPLGLSKTVAIFSRFWNSDWRRGGRRQAMEGCTSIGGKQKECAGAQQDFIYGSFKWLSYVSGLEERLYWTNPFPNEKNT